MIKLGDVVRLKSGGPWMTVSELRADGYITCEWFIKTSAEEVFRSAFEPDTLEPYRWWRL